MRKREMIGPVVVALLRMRFRLDGQIHRFATACTTGHAVVRSAPDTTISLVRPNG